MSSSQRTGLAFARIWHLVDAKNQTLGKLAQRVSIALRGKYKPVFHPSADCGDYVVVINARHLQMTGKKEEQKEYRWHSRWPGGDRSLTYNKFLENHPTGPIKKAIYGMMPKNNLRRQQFKRLFVFADDDHPYEPNILKEHDQGTPKN
ncbi:54S ribosomal protein L23, mitochondrial [Phlyctochytrium planicorne]|nr:54S ribosomal protein L23, mitochondrial [Phlyctochytrium planicorne]